MADDAITQGGKGGQGSLIYIYGLYASLSLSCVPPSALLTFMQPFPITVNSAILKPHIALLSAVKSDNIIVSTILKMGLPIKPVPHF